MIRKLTCPKCKRERWINCSNHLDWAFGRYKCICNNEFIFYNTDKGIMSL